jgi:hypothetical protein
MFHFGLDLEGRLPSLTRDFKDTMLILWHTSGGMAGA